MGSYREIEWKSMVRDKAFGIPEHGMHENSCGHDLNYDCTVFISSHLPPHVLYMFFIIYP